MNNFLRAMLVIACAFGAAISAQAQSNYEPYPFSTFAGNAGYGSSDGTGSAASFNSPSGVAVDSASNVYVADTNNNTIRKITSAGVASTLAGMAGSLGSADGTGSAARFNSPYAVAVDGSGNVYVADSGNNTIRKITPAGVVTTLAGLAGATGSSDGPGNAARFNFPQSVAVDGSGNVYVADSFNYTIRKITPAGVVTTLAGSAGNFGSGDGTGSAARFNNPRGVAVTSAGLVYVADTYNQTIRKVTSGGVVSTFAGSAGFLGSNDGSGSSALFAYPAGVAVDGSGNVYVADESNFTIRKITSAAFVTTLAGSVGNQGSADGTGSAARFKDANGVATTSAGEVYVADTSNNTIRKVTAAGVVTTFAGLAGSFGSADGTGSAARFNSPSGVAVDSAGNVYVGDYDNSTIRKITPAAVVTTLAGMAGSPGSANGTGAAARFNSPAGVAVDSGGNVYVADTFNQIIRKITPGAVVTTFAGAAGSSGSVGGAGTVARFFNPGGVAVDSAGNVYVADTGNHTIRKITSAAFVTTLAGTAGLSGSSDGTGSAARFSSPYGVAVDSAGNVFVADTNNNTIRKITPAGVVTTVAGVPGISGSTDGSSITRFSSPYGVAVDSIGNIFVADLNGQTVRKINPAGVVRTLAGLFSTTGAADGTGSAVRFNYLRSVAVNSAGLLYVADTNNHTIRVGGPAPAPVTQTFNAANLPQAFQNGTFANGASTTFSNLPNSTSISLSVDVTVTNTTLSNLKIIVFPGTFGPTGLPPTGPVFTLWNHEKLVNGAGQPVTHLQTNAILPFAGGDRYTVLVVDDTYGSPTMQVGVFNSCSLTIQPSNPGHTAPPTVNLYGGTLNQPVPSQLDYAQPLTLVARASGNPSSYTIARLRIVITGPESYNSPEVFEASPGAGASVTFTPAILPPGNYVITATAIDSAGFAQTATANLTVNRLFGLFSIANLASTVNANQTTGFSANLVVTNNTATGSGNLRVHLIQVASASFRDVEGPPDLTPYPTTELSLIPVSALGAGATTQVPISGLVRAPVDNSTGQHPELQNRIINFHVYATLDELGNGQWVPIDSLKVIDGVQKRDVDFGGPGGGVNDPPPNFGGTPFDPKILQSVDVTGPINVADSGAVQYVAMATATNKAGPTTLPVTGYSQWGSSQFDISLGSFQPSFVSNATPVQLSASFKLSTNSPTKTGTLSVMIYPFRITSITVQSNGAILNGKGIPGQTAYVQASPDLVTPFSDIGLSVADGGGVITFPAPHASGLPKRFYRLRYP